MQWHGRFAWWLAVLSAAVGGGVDGCGGGSKHSRAATRAAAPPAPAAVPSNTTSLPLSANGPTACTVYESGYATQVVFASRTFDVRAECRTWTRSRSGEGFLWGYQPAGTNAEPANSRELCFLEDSRGNVAVRVLEVSGFQVVTKAQAAQGSSACMSLMSFGWIRQPSARVRRRPRN
jgi:hypothetical protein